MDAHAAYMQSKGAKKQRNKDVYLSTKGYVWFGVILMEAPEILRIRALWVVDTRCDGVWFGG